MGFGTLRIAITGAAGFIGSFVTERLLAEGHEVVGLDNFDTYYSPRIKRRNLVTALASPHFRLLEGDFREPAVVDDLFRTAFDAVIHLGARAGVRPSLLDAALYSDVNVTGTVRLLEAARRRDVRKFIFASSSSVYGSRSAKPFHEEDVVDTPVSPYAATKKAGELLCYTYHHLFELDVSCLRFFTVYGPRQRPEMAIHKFASSIDRSDTIQVYGDGSALRDFTYIDDIVDGVCRSLEHCKGYHIYNLGRGETVELRHVIRLLEKELGKKANIEFLAAEPGDVPVTFADIERARAEIDYDPKVSIEDGIHRFVEWLRAETRDV